MNLKLVPDSISTDTVEALKHMYDEALAGQLTGLAFVALYRRQEFVVNTAGECYAHPIQTRGMVGFLIDFLALQINEDILRERLIREPQKREDDGNGKKCKNGNGNGTGNGNGNGKGKGSTRRK